MTAHATPSYFPSMPPTFGSCRVVELADEFKVSTADMLAICDRLGVVVEDVLIALLAAGTGALGDRWVEYVTATDAPATVVTTSEP